MRLAVLLAAVLAAAEASGTGALLVLALVQGLTEFLPVSSSGHLVLVQHALGLEHASLTVDVALHVGTLCAVLVVYRRDVAAVARDLLRGRAAEALWIALGTLPAVVVGLTAKDAIERAFEAPRVAALGLFVTALLLAGGEAARRARAHEAPRPLGWRVALGVGLAQALAICPGISRSGSTIAAGLALGLAPAAAARFSFLLAIPAIAGAAVLQLPDARTEALPPAGTLALAVGVAGLVGWFALRLLLAFLGRGAFAWFALYCALLGTGVLLFGPA